MKKRKKSKEAKSPKSFGNLRLWGSIIIILIAVFLKFNPTAFNGTLSVITGVDCDYTLMLSDLREVIYAHTTGNKIFKMPVYGTVTSPFGKRKDPLTNEETEHFGIDIDAPLNTPVCASYSGKVLRVEENEYYGKFIMIEHSKNLVSLYGHLNEQKVLPGDIIKTGATIGLSGSTGKSTGPHLHFEIRKDGKCVNPEDYLL